MHIDDIRQELEEIDSKIFMYSLKKDLSIKQLTSLYSKLLECRSSFLMITFDGVEIGEIEELRFSLLEEIYMIRIFTKEKVGQDVSKEIEKLKHIYKNNEK